MKIISLVFLASLTIGCEAQLCPVETEPTDPPGFCEDHADCDSQDFCMSAFCERISDGQICRDIERCFPRLQEGDGCTSLRDCQDGLFCKLTDVTICLEGNCPEAWGVCTIDN